MFVHRIDSIHTERESQSKSSKIDSKHRAEIRNRKRTANGSKSSARIAPKELKRTVKQPMQPGTEKPGDSHQLSKDPIKNRGKRKQGEIPLAQNQGGSRNPRH